MEARKFATQMAAICPFALLLGMGYSARQPGTMHHVLQYSAAQNARLAAYRPIFAQESSLEAGVLNARPEADRWIRLARAAKLQPLTPAYQEDLLEDNARGEIIAQWTVLEQQLNRDVRREVAYGEFASAIEDGTRLIRLNEILKYSDFQTVHFATTTTIHAVVLLGPVLPNVSAGDRRAFKAAVSASNHNRGRLPALYNVMKTNFEDYAIRCIGLGRDSGAQPSGMADDDAGPLSVDTTNLQRSYVLAVRDEAKFRANAQSYLGMRFNPVRS